MTSRRKSCEGAALIESCIVIILLCLILFGILQVSLVTAAYDVNIYAASCAVRSAAVGYSDKELDSMVNKVLHVAALPAAGPKPEMHVSAERQIAKAYLLTDQIGDRLSYVPGEYWDSYDAVSIERSGGMAKLSLSQNYPLSIPFVRAFSPDYEVVLNSGEVRMMNHSDLYLQ